MRSRSRLALIQMSIVLSIVAAVLAAVVVWRWEFVHTVFLSDWKSIALNGVVLTIFLLGVGHLFKELGHYDREEQVLARFDDGRRGGRTTIELLNEADDRSLVADRYRTVRMLFDRGVPIDHGTIASISLAGESLRQSVPRFVNNVLILTGVFGTVSSLIFALIGASDVLRSALPGEGMGVMLLGMNTALTTTASAIVCYFLFSFFYMKLTDVQTGLMARLERIVLMDIIPEFQFEPQTIDHQSKNMLQELGRLVQEIRIGVADARKSLSDLEARGGREVERWDTALANQQDQARRLDAVTSGLDEVRRVLLDGFRLK